MTDNQAIPIDSITLKILGLLKIKKELSKLKIFKEPKLDNDYIPSNATYETYSNYIFCTCKLKEKQALLLKFALKLIKINGINYFPLRLPSDYELREEVYLILKEAEIKTTKHLTISWNSKISVTSLKNPKMPRYWEEKIKILRAIFESSLNFVSYKLPQKQSPRFPLYIPNKTAEAFIKLHNATAYTFYYHALIYHIALNTGIIGQNSTNKVIANIEDIRTLLPSNLTIDKLLAISKTTIHKIEKSSKKLIITYNLEKLNNLYEYSTEEKTIKHQRINVPMRLLPHIFKAESFGKNGTAYALLILFGYRCKHPKVNYKPSTIVKLANINTKRGIEYTLKALNKPLQYLQNLGLIGYQTITKEVYKADIAVTIELYPFSRVKF